MPHIHYLWGVQEEAAARHHVRRSMLPARGQQFLQVLQDLHADQKVEPRDAVRSDRMSHTCRTSSRRPLRLPFSHPSTRILHEESSLRMHNTAWGLTFEGLRPGSVPATRGTHTVRHHHIPSLPQAQGSDSSLQLRHSASGLPDEAGLVLLRRKRFAVCGAPRLEDAIHRYMEARKRDPKRFVWTAAVELIVDEGRTRQRLSFTRVGSSPAGRDG